MEKMIYETNNKTMDKEEEIKKFDSKQKQLITEEEECLKVLFFSVYFNSNQTVKINTKLGKNKFNFFG